MIKSFDPIIANHPKVLILGSIPSVTSLEKNEYYGFKHNRFWKIISTYFHIELNTYEDKINCIKNNHIILWDVIKMCEREGSLDSKIKKEVCNEIDLLLNKYPSVNYVLCNGNKSYDLYMKYYSHLPVEVIKLPSTSNANRTISQEKLFEVWFETLKQCI